jgi:ABC-type lipoprotein release transport system permease subunit
VLLSGVTPQDPVVLERAAMVLVSIGIVASLTLTLTLTLTPAWRASRVDPVVAMRAE